MQETFARYSKHYTRMGNVPPDWEEAEREPAKHRLAAPWLPADPEARILDFGCGWGHLLRQLWCSGYRNLEGVEVSESQYEVARTRAGGRVRLCRMDGREFLGAVVDKYDLVILSDVIEHVPVEEANGLLVAIREGLRPGGIVVVRTPNMATLFSSYSRYLDMTHVAGYTEFSLMQILDAASFENHRFVEDDWGISWRRWRPWAPWRGTGLAALSNRLIHEALYLLRGQHPRPTRFGFNLEVYSERV